MATILIATQDSSDFAVLSAEAEGEGFGVLWATDGQEAIDLALSQGPVAVFIAGSLPIFDGFEATEILRRDPDISQDLPIYLYSDESVEPHRFEQVGFTGQFPTKHAYQDTRELLAQINAHPAMEL